MKTDLCLYYVREAVQLSEEYEEISAYDYFYETADDKAEKNEKLENRITASLTKAVDAILKMISDITTKVKEMTQQIFKSAEHQALINNCEESVKENPELANEKIEFVDLKKVDAAYDKAIQEADKASKDDADPSLGEKIMHTLKNNLGKITIAVGVVTAIGLYKRSEQHSNGILRALKREETLTEALRKKINRGMRDLKRKTKGHSKQLFWQRFKVNILRKKQETVFSMMKRAISDIKSLITISRNEDATTDPKLISKQLKHASSLANNRFVTKTAAVGLKGAALGITAADKAKNVKNKFDKMVTNIKEKRSKTDSTNDAEV